MPVPLLSLIIPAYNEEARLPETLKRVFEFVSTLPYTTEVVVVENGSSDQTFQIAKAFAGAHPEMCLLQNAQKGKGRAVRQGMLAAHGEYRFMCDVDFSMPVSEIERFLPPALQGCDVAIASREAPGAQRFGEPYYRHFIGRVYNVLSRLIVLPGLQDTQCGFKCFRGGVAEDLFRRQTLTGLSFDVEILYIARLLGYKIVEVAIPWYYNPRSKINVVRDSFQTGLDLLTIRLNGLRGVYTAPHAKI